MCARGETTVACMVYKQTSHVQIWKAVTNSVAIVTTTQNLPVIFLLRWPDTFYLREGQLFWNQIFSCSTTFDFRDILDTEKEILEVYQKRTFIEIDTNIRKFSAIFLNVVFKENAYYRENEKTFFLHITLNRCWNIKDFRDQVSARSAPHNLYSKRWLKLLPEHYVHADVTNRRMQNSKTACVILICFFNKTVFRDVWLSSSRVTRICCLISEKRIVRIRQNLLRSFVIDCFMGVHDGFFEIRQGVKKLSETWKTTWLP